MATKIEKELTPEEVVELLETLAKTPGGTVLRVIQDEARKRGIEVSLMGAGSFRDAALHPYLQKLRDAKAKSEMLAEAITAGDEDGLVAGARTQLAEQVIDFLMTEGASPKQFSSLAMTLNMLSSSNQNEKMTTARLKVLEAKEEERQRARAVLEAKRDALVKKGGLSEEGIALMEEQFQLLG